VEVKDHGQLVGAIVTNLPALETVLRYHSMGPQARDVVVDFALAQPVRCAGRAPAPAASLTESESRG